MRFTSIDTIRSLDGDNTVILAATPEMMQYYDADNPRFSDGDDVAIMIRSGTSNENVQFITFIKSDFHQCFYDCLICAIPDDKSVTKTQLISAIKSAATALNRLYNQSIEYDDDELIL